MLQIQFGKRRVNYDESDLQLPNGASPIGRQENGKQDLEAHTVDNVQRLENSAVGRVLRSVQFVPVNLVFHTILMKNNEPLDLL